MRPEPMTPKNLPEAISRARRADGALVLVTHRGDWCPFCCGQLVALAADEPEFSARGAEIVAIGADTRAVSDALMARWALPYYVIDDTDGTKALRALDLWNAEEHGGIAAVGAVVFNADGEEVWRTVGRDVADRPDRETLLRILETFGLPGLHALPPLSAPDGQGGPEAFPTWAFEPYFQAVRVTTGSLRGRMQCEQDLHEVTSAGRLAQRYLEAWALWRRRTERAQGELRQLSRQQ